MKVSLLMLKQHTANHWQTKMRKHMGARTHTQSGCITDLQTLAYDFISFSQKKAPIARSPAGSFQQHTGVLFASGERVMRGWVGKFCVFVKWGCWWWWSWGARGGVLMADEWPSLKRSATLQGWCGEASSTHQLIKCQWVRLDVKREAWGEERLAGKIQETVADR